MGPEANVSHSAVRTYSTFWTVGSCLPISVTPQFHPMSGQLHVTGQAVQMLESWLFGMRWVWCVLELHRSAFSSVDTGWNLTDWDMELILESDSDAHLSEEEDICVQTGSDTGDTDTSHSGLTIQTFDLLYFLPTSLRRIPAGYNEQSASINTVAHWVFSCSSFLSYNCWWLRHILSLALGHIGWKTVLTAWIDCSGNVFVSGDYCGDGARSEGHAER
jgi:hypothetical protein